MTKAEFRTPRQLAIHIAIAAAMALSAPVNAYDLDQHAWRDRLLIVAAPQADGPAVTQQIEAISQRSDAIQDRRLRVIELYADRGSIDGHPLLDDDVAQLRRHFNVPTEASTMLLIGLDGRVKRRAALGTELRELFVQIDEMPMRQSEIRAKRAAGKPVTPP